MSTTHTLSVLVEDTPGVLARVAALFSRRGFNIQSLAVGATEQKNMSRMTIVVCVEEQLPLEQITKQLNKLINVIKIVEQEPDNSDSRELALIKVRADATTRGQHMTGLRGQIGNDLRLPPSKPVLSLDLKDHGHADAGSRFDLAIGIDETKP